MALQNHILAHSNMKMIIEEGKEEEGTMKGEKHVIYSQAPTCRGLWLTMIFCIIILHM
jgi:hypothetical protein